MLGQELPALIAEGSTSIKIFMTFDDMRLADREILEVLDVAREHEALVMVHAEGYGSIRFLSERLEREAKPRPAITVRHARSPSSAKQPIAPSASPKSSKLPS
ncbi:dihydroorotase-like cyclic amidohydrolase [Pararhizobium capsulatum DSM 1112]|uniref:Dihydroorotase-like cyclic amidohydrolase n=1 Tax=Pararhizobium capsulatum DSM 1112 TaxID=1121113 RepID=A0ABU0C0P2_9HYPH|nr:dihydroorotase-like cyclic amidohydrolase [Pararhizobium capsulatum DSM 1112]